MRSSIIILLFNLLFTDCSGGDRQQPEDKEATAGVGNTLHSIPDSNEVSIPDIGKTKVKAESTIEIRFEREVEYGSTREVIVGNIATFTVDDKGRVFIADEDQAVIHVFNSDGSYLTFLGRQGQGPGEIQNKQCTGATPKSINWLLLLFFIQSLI